MNTRVIKDDFVHIRISTREKKILEEKAKEMGLNISNFFLFAARELARSDAKGSAAAIDEKSFQGLHKRIDRLEQLILENRAIIPQGSTKEEEEFFKINWAAEKICWMLQQEQFQKKTAEEIAAALLKEEPDLEDYLKRTTKRAFSALDIALDMLEEEGALKIGRKGILQWNE